MTLRICTDKLVKPNDFSGLVAWFDMQDPASYTNTSNAVSAIVNKATGVSYSQTTSGERPAIVSGTSGINGLTCMDFDGTDDKIQSASDSTLIAAFNDDKPYTVFYVARHDTVDRAETVFGIANSAGTQSFRGWGQNTTSAGRWQANGNTAGSVAQIVDSSGSSNGNNNVFEWFGNGTASMQLNGGADDPNAAAWVVGATPAVNRASIGCRGRSANDHLFDGKVGEIVVYSSILSLQNRTAIRRYLGAKWGVTVS